MTASRWRYTQTVELANLPNSLVVAPNGATAYLGSSAGLMVVNLTTYPVIAADLPDRWRTQHRRGHRPGAGSLAGQPLRRALRRRNGYVFLIDTTGTKVATRYTIPGINAVTFAADDSNFWIGGTAGVYVFNAEHSCRSAHDSDRCRPQHQREGAGMDAGRPVLLRQRRPVGQLFHLQQPESERRKRLPRHGGPSIWIQPPLAGCPRWSVCLGTEWLDYSVTTTAQVAPTVRLTAYRLRGNVCLSTVTVNPPVSTAPSLPCAATQVTFSPTLEAGIRHRSEPFLHDRGAVHSRLRPGDYASMR